MEERMNEKSIWLPFVLRRMHLFLFWFSLLIFLLFLLGNIQEFLDSTQRLLLTMLGFSSVLCVMIGCYVFIALIVYWIVWKRGQLIRLIFYVLTTAVACITALIAHGILIWIRGIP